ncbi:MAG: class I SAM-dependent methyltransferase [Actinomycetota bacterium]|nr:class I SAM-dependent methyltransferase [Actinomycetota bacterium]
MNQKENSWNMHAQWWQNNFTNGKNKEYSEQLLPLIVELMDGCEKIIDIGAGEGQILRALNPSANYPIGIDISERQVLRGKKLAPNTLLMRAAAEELPFNDSSFDGAIACLVFEHVELEMSIREAARVLKDSGKFVIAINHPMILSTGSMWVEDWVSEPPEKYWKMGAYLREEISEENFGDGVSIPFTHRPLNRYVNILSECGFSITRMIEPEPYFSLDKDSPWRDEMSYIPRLLLLVCEYTSGRA